jgi:hypothetical protein
MESPNQKDTNGRPRRSTRRGIKSKVTVTATAETQAEKELGVQQTKKTVKKNVTKDIPHTNDVSSNDSNKDSPKQKKRTSSSDQAVSSAKESKRTKKVEPQRITERDELKRLWDAKEAIKKHGSYSKFQKNILFLLLDVGLIKTLSKNTVLTRYSFSMIVFVVSIPNHVLERSWSSGLGSETTRCPC